MLEGLNKLIKNLFPKIEEDVLEKNSFTSSQLKILADISVRFNLEEPSPALFREIIKMLGEYTDVSRAYIFFDSPDGKHTTNEYEWVNTGVEPQIQNLQNYPYTSLPSLKKYIYDEGILLSYDVSKLEEDLRTEFESEGIKSILLLPIFISLSPIGFIGFDEIRKLRKWSEPEVKVCFKHYGKCSCSISCRARARGKG